MAELSPDDNSQLITTTELEYVSETITASGFSTINWEWEFVGIPPAPDDVEGINFNVTDSGFELTVSYFDNDGLFPFQYVDYVTPNDERIRVNSFNELPDIYESPYIVEMREDDKDLLDWQFIVTVIGTDSQTQEPVNLQYTYGIRVFANYNTARDRLKEELDARSSI